MNKCKGFSKLWFLGLLLVAFVAGCANNGDETPIIADTTPPTVTVTSPTNLAPAVPVNRKISVAFSESMAPASFSTASFTLKETGTSSNLPGTFVPADTSIVFTPDSLLTPNKDYTVTIKGGVSGGVKDLTGTAMVSDFVFTFKTGVTSDATAPTIISTGAFDGEEGLPVNRSPTATFSEQMNPATLVSPATSFTVCATDTKGGACVTPVVGVVTYLGNTATFNPNSDLAANTWYKSTITNKAEDMSGLALISGLIPNPLSWKTGAVADTVAPKITSTNPAKLATNVPVDKKINVTFNEAMNPATMITANFTVKKTGPPLGLAIAGTVAYDVQHNIATFSPQSNLDPDTNYTVTVTNGAKDLAGNALLVPAVDGLNPWTFKTAATPVVQPPVANILLTAATYGTFGGTAGMTNQGILTIINGDIGTTATTTSTVTGFHDTELDIFTETTLNKGAVNGTILTCTTSTTGPTAAAVNVAYCDAAKQARLDAQAAYLELSLMPSTGVLAGNLSGLTIYPGVYTNSSSVEILGSDLTLDALGDPNAIFVFQIGSSLTVGGPSVAAARSVILTNGAQAKNVFWQVGTFATINPGGGGTMVGTIITAAGLSISTADNVELVTLNGRAISLGASVTMVNTVINVPEP